MLIPIEKVVECLREHSISIRGVLHVGAHECEELVMYKNVGIDPLNVSWIEANPDLVARMKERGIHVHQAAVSDKEEDIEFHITNNGQSSSLLEFGTHEKSYSWVKVVKKINVRTQTLERVILNNSIPIYERNFWNLDIQGVELNALKSANHLINFADAIYSEINTEEVYKKCGLLKDMDEFLSSKGFERKMTAMTDKGWGDALWVRIPHK